MQSTVLCTVIETNPLKQDMKKKAKTGILWMCPVDPYFFGMNEFEAWKAGRSEQQTLCSTETAEPAEKKEPAEKIRRWEARVYPSSRIGKLFLS
jgi:hypothetical protein